MAIYQSTNNDLKLSYFKIRCSGNVSGSGWGSYIKSNVTCHKCGKKGHIQEDCRSTGTGFSGNPPKKSTNELPECVTKKPVLSYTKYLVTFTMTLNNKRYNWCTSCNNGNGAWGFHWKDACSEWGNKQGKKSSVKFSNTANNAIICWSYLITTSEDSTEE